MAVISVFYTVYLGGIHGKEIAIRYQKDLSFGLLMLSGILGIIIDIRNKDLIFLIGALMNTTGVLSIYFSFQKGIVYDIQ